MRGKYQKVVVCIDEHSDIKFIDNLIEKISKDVVLIKYYYNHSNINSFFDTINSGVRVVIYNVTDEHFYKLQSDNNFLINIFLPQSNFVLPYISNVESVYGDNLLVCDNNVKDYISVIFMYEMALNKLWHCLLQGVEVDVTIFKIIDLLINSNDNFYVNLISVATTLKTELDDEYKQVSKEQLPYYVYLKLCAILKMFENLNNNNEQYIDFYKTEMSSNAIEKAHALIIKHSIIDIIKYNGCNLIKITAVILNRLKIIIKKYFNFKNIKLNKLNNIIKNQSKTLNIDNLLFISYIFNTI